MTNDLYILDVESFYATPYFIIHVDRKKGTFQMQQYQYNNTWDMRVCSMFKCSTKTLPTSNACEGISYNMTCHILSLAKS